MPPPNPTILTEPTPTPFDFSATVTAHGWAMLSPFELSDDHAALSRVHRLSGGQVVRLTLRPAPDSAAVQIQVESDAPLSPAGEAELRAAVRRMLRLDEDLSEFYQLQEQMSHWPLSLAPGGGRLLRCPTLFEDIVYTLCTTNIAWSGTIRMVERLTATLGSPRPGQPEQRAFPSPAAIAQAGPERLKQETGLGYRSPYVWELAMAVAEERLDLSRFEAPDASTGELYEALRQLKGVGPYAAATLLMILGRYDRLAIDSAMRSFVSQKYYEGQSVTESQIKKVYAPWGRWQYLAYWFDPPPEPAPSPA